MCNDSKQALTLRVPLPDRVSVPRSRVWLLEIIRDRREDQQGHLGGSQLSCPIHPLNERQDSQALEGEPTPWTDLPSPILKQLWQFQYKRWSVRYELSEGMLRLGTSSRHFQNQVIMCKCAHAGVWQTSHWAVMLQHSGTLVNTCVRPHAKIWDQTNVWNDN